MWLRKQQKKLQELLKKSYVHHHLHYDDPLFYTNKNPKDYLQRLNGKIFDNDHWRIQGLEKVTSHNNKNT